jgi:hypothetical protein
MVYPSVYHLFWIGYQVRLESELEVFIFFVLQRFELKGLMLVTTLYHLSHAPILFLTLVTFWIGSYIFFPPELASD